MLLCSDQLSKLNSVTSFNPASIIEFQHELEYEFSKAPCDLIQKEIESRLCMSARKYGTGGLLMGVLGYYNPSRIFDKVYANVKRGRILNRKPLSPTYVYDFDSSGKLSRVISNSLQTTTYIVYADSSEVCFSISNIFKDVAHVIIRLNDDSGQTSKWLEFCWHDCMKIASTVYAELYHDTDNGHICTTIRSVSDENEVFRVLSYNEYSFEVGENGKVRSLTQIKYSSEHL